MLRFIFKRVVYDDNNGKTDEMLSTLDMDVPEIQYRLSEGGCGTSGYDQTYLLGIEVLPEFTEETPKVAA